MNTCPVLTADLLHFAAPKNPSTTFPSLVTHWAVSYRLCFVSPEHLISQEGQKAEMSLKPALSED